MNLWDFSTAAVGTQRYTGRCGRKFGGSYDATPFVNLAS